MTLSGARVLLAEDDEGVRFAIGKTLRRQGCTVKEAADGMEALRMLEAEPIDLLIADRRLPSLGGEDLAGRCVELHPRVAVLFITGLTSNAATSRTLPRAVTLSKPFSMALLVQQASTLLAEAPSSTP